MKIEKASKKRTKARLATFSPSGGGKTYSSLAIATGMVQSGEFPEGARIVVIDTEHRSAEKYADRFDFDVLNLEEPTVDNTIAAMALCKDYTVCIIDSFSHAWRELLAEVDQIAEARYHGNTNAAWKEGSKKQKKMITAILKFPGHLIVTMRSKTEWSMETTSQGKVKPVRVGLAPEQGKGIEYEFDILMELTQDHIANILKDRTNKFQDRIIEKPGESFGIELIEWLNEGEAPVPEKSVAEKFKEMVDDKDLTDQAVALLLLYLNEIQDRAFKKTQTRISHDDVKAGALKAPTKFWAGFHDYVNKYDDKREDKNDEAQDDAAAPAGDPPAREAEGVVGEGEVDPGDSDADCF